ncbi:hypothetical protein GGX14DRAFT_582952 [Mycena pura]|uniref:Uncharacterized protein n=1 Tax=Mycena pura TaxID=153505 RepID=A0AAD6YVJ2_9AGAR|nr:hypothetical protein GGX14DRAFT_582952 [Mycena pura]
MVPQLPVELAEQITSAAWHMPLSSQERIALMRSSALVNSTWAALFDRISSRDVYIPSSAYCDHFIQRLRTQPRPIAPSSSFLGGFVRLFQKPSAPAAEPHPANLACRSITIQIANPAVHPNKYNRAHLPMAAALDELMEYIDAHGLAPHLRRLSVEYLNAPFDDVFRRVGLGALPPQIEHLELRFSFGAEMPPWLARALRENQERQRHFGWAARDVTHLSVFGAGESTVQDLLRACPNVRTLDGDCGEAKT